MPTSAPPAPKSSSPSQTEALRLRADALYRCALECARQHERIARLMDKELTPTEQRIQREVVALCDEALTEISSDYEKCSARVHPTGDDETWWRKANAVWLASREYLRRNRLSDLVGRRASDQTREKFGEMQMDYELEASALLALQQSLSAYKKARPDAE
jgi:hypothetical protein